MKRFSSRPFKVVAINLLILVVLLEVASIGFYFYQTGRFFYLAPKDQNNQTTTVTSNNSPDPASSLTHRLHPYLGFVYDRQTNKKLLFSKVSYTANNYGIMSPYQYPYKKTNDQFIIGIFGGSVGMFSGFYEMENQVLVNALKRLPDFQNKQIVVLPFANGAYKQPQQLIALNYLLSVGQEFDMVINIDGFNETALSNLNNKSSLEVSMPNVEILAPLVALVDKNLSLSELTLTLEILKLRAELRESAATLEKCRIATCHTFEWMKLQYRSGQYQKKLEAFNAPRKSEKETDSLVHVNRHDKPLDDDEAFRQMADEWASASIAMNQLLSQKRIPYFHVLQPNQYYSTARNFSQEEKTIAVDPSSRYAEGVSKGYPQLIGRIGDLQKAGVKIINGVNVFDESKEVVYEDTCCHYNQAGNELFATFMARNIVESLTARTAPQ